MKMMLGHGQMPIHAGAGIHYQVVVICYQWSQSDVLGWYDSGISFAKQNATNSIDRYSYLLQLRMV